MANNRIYLRCRKCGQTLFLGKNFGAEWFWTDYEHTGHLEDKLNDFFLEHCFCDNEYNEDECLKLDTPIGKINRFDTNFEIAYERDEPEEVKNAYNCLWAIMPTMVTSDKEEGKGE